MPRRATSSLGGRTKAASDLWPYLSSIFGNGLRLSASHGALTEEGLEKLTCGYYAKVKNPEQSSISKPDYSRQMERIFAPDRPSGARRRQD